MDPNAVLGPVDPQIGQSPASSILSVLQHKESKDIDDQTLIFADVARKATAQLNATVRELLSAQIAQKDLEPLADKLTSGKGPMITQSDARLTYGAPLARSRMRYSKIRLERYVGTSDNSFFALPMAPSHRRLLNSPDRPPNSILQA
jgi:hypothetical protein